MPTRNVVITQHQEALIASLVESGRFQNASEVLRAGLRLLESQESEDAARLARLREAIQVGLDDLERGDFIDFDSAEEAIAHLTEFTDPILKSQ